MTGRLLKGGVQVRYGIQVSRNCLYKDSVAEGNAVQLMSERKKYTGRLWDIKEETVQTQAGA